MPLPINERREKRSGKGDGIASPHIPAPFHRRWSGGAAGRVEGHNPATLIPSTAVGNAVALNSPCCARLATPVAGTLAGSGSYALATHLSWESHPPISLPWGMGEESVGNTLSHLS